MSVTNWVAGGLATLAAPFALAWLRKRALDVPSAALGFLSREWAEYVGSRVDDKTRLLFSRCAHAAFEWAEDEMPDMVGPEKMDAVVVELEKLPAVGALVSANEAAVRGLLQDEYKAWKGEVDAESKKSGQL